MDNNQTVRILSPYQRKVITDALGNGGIIADSVTINTRKVLKRENLITYDGANAVLTPIGREVGELILQNS